MIWIIITIISVSIGIAGFYFLLVYAEAKLEVDSSPREPMFECVKHGMFRKKHLVNFLDSEMCPLCFDEKVHTRLDSSVIAEAFNKFAKK